MSSPATADIGLLREHARRIAPVVLAKEQLLMVPEVFHTILPSGGLQRGWTTCVSGGATGRILAWALLAEVTRSGGWVAAVDIDGISLRSAQEVGLAIERVLVVDCPEADDWVGAVGALIGSVDVIVFGTPKRRIPPSLYRRLASRCRERGTVLVELGSPGKLEYDLSFAVSACEWRGLGQGHGRLEARELDVTVTGRRARGKSRSARFALPDIDGLVRVRTEHEAPVLRVVN